MSSVSDIDAEGLAENEDVVIVMLVDLEDLGVSLRGDDLVSQSNVLSVKGDLGQVVDFNRVLSHDNLNSEFVVGDLLSKNNVSWLVTAVSRDESGAL